MPSTSGTSPWGIASPSLSELQSALTLTVYFEGTANTIRPVTTQVSQLYSFSPALTDLHRPTCISPPVLDHYQSTCIAPPVLVLDGLYWTTCVVT